MLKQVHKILTTLVIGCFLLTPSITYAVDDIQDAALKTQNEASDEISVSRGISQQGDVELIQNDINVEDLDVEPISTGKLKESVVPDPNKEGKKVIGLFLKTMVAVLVCAVLLYFILLFVKRFYSSSFVDSESEELDSFDLSTPNNKNDALKSFLNKTK